MISQENLESTHIERLIVCVGFVNRGANRAEDKRKAKQCQLYSAAILRFHNIDVSSDCDSTKYPKTFCVKCNTRHNRLKRSVSVSDMTLETARKEIDQAQSIWIAYSPSITIQECSVCVTRLKSRRREADPTISTERRKTKQHV